MHQALCVEQVFHALLVRERHRKHEAIVGVADLRAALLKRPERFLFNLTEKLMIYALGRGVEYYDMPYVRAILKESSKTDYRFSSLVLGIIKSPTFQRRRSES